MRFRIGILGSYGRAGRCLVQEFAKEKDVTLVLAGRDAGKANDLLKSAGIDSGIAVAADALDAVSLKRFCEQTDLVINCTGPLSLVRDRVAQAALDARAHYVDLGGYDVVYAPMKLRNEELQSAGRVCMMSAGLLPGVADLMLQDMAARFDEPLSIDFYCGGGGDLTLPVFEDMIHHVFPRPVGTYKNGVWTPRSKWATKSYEFPGPIGKQVVLPLYWAELNDFATARKIPHVGWSLAVNLPFLAIKDVTYPIFKNHTKLGARILKLFYDRQISKYEGMSALIIEAEGRKNGELRHMTATLVCRGNEHYSLSAPPCAMAARKIMNGAFAPGVHVLAGAVQPGPFLESLRPKGLSIRIDEKKL